HVIAVLRGPSTPSATRPPVSVSVFLEHMGDNATAVCLDTGVSLTVARALAMATPSS
ncbi:hypothetical protein M9458_049093, partial [Cirrhinus mrigala]